jgi:hypothetical protein
MIKLANGTLVYDEFCYRKMETNRPLPWVGMPIYYTSQPSCYNDGWYFVVAKTVNGRVLANNLSDSHSKCLVSYGYDDKHGFILPGEPDCPALPKEVMNKLYSPKSFPKRKLVSREDDGIWRLIPVTPTRSCLSLIKLGKTLPIPGKIEELFLNNNKKTANSISSLGQETTIQDPTRCTCGGPPKEVVVGFLTSNTAIICTICKKEK